MVKFVVLESKQKTKKRHYARIHRASCGHAKKPGYKTARTSCHGYFDEYFEALDFAKSLNVEGVYDCEFCSPRHISNRVRAQVEREEAEG